MSRILRQRSRNFQSDLPADFNKLSFCPVIFDIHTNLANCMKNVFKKQLNEKEYAFYRTMDGSETAYFILFDEQGKRTSVKIEKDNYGDWKPAKEPSFLTGMVAHECLRAITENERSLVTR